MIMKIINSEEHLCTCCMEKHEVKTVLVREQATFKNIKIREPNGVVATLIYITS